ncbi:MAG: HlyD family efflux transporter periplasmic adaptor subunit [Hoeflea sp.]|uniref:HlyD family secretion protein n=1 Tax=Hoeflea sp. TaxID=1940281 RepID=UPI00272F083B|nr:HlyD family efflux transporter periplasmic adaptor subunit [Hoeflea sp.]MDP2120880.1 HlyD family efflux transporter periplasmic adaptor subunit [Hoeflea sp.]
MSFLCSLPLLSALAFLCGGPGPLAVGYVEGEYVLVAPIETAQIVDLAVRRGDHVMAGQSLGRLEWRDAEIAVAQAEAALAQAESQLANLQEGRQPEEIASIVAALGSARAQAAESERVMQRQRDLLVQGISTQATFDAASTSAELARAKVAELEANLAVARLPARSNEIKAAQAAVEQAKAALESSEWRLSKRTLSIPQAGVVSDIIRNAGEVAGPQAPVLSVLPDGAIKLKLYVAEFALSSLSVGAGLTVNCDGCGEGMRATVSYISADPEFTPPVIYSLETRQKLVYLIEARPEAGAWALTPGQIVDVALEGDGR